MKISTWIDIANALKDFYDTTDTVLEHQNAAKRARLGKTPFPPPKEVQKLLDANDRLQKHLKSVAKKGLPAPQQPKVGFDDLLSKPGATCNGLQKLNQTLKIRHKHARDIEKKIAELGRLVKEAKAKSQGAKFMRDFWEKAFRAPLPDIGSINKTEFFKYHQWFQRLGGSLSSTARAAEKAKRKLKEDLDAYKESTKVMESNVRTFFRLSIM